MRHLEGARKRTVPLLALLAVACGGEAPPVETPLRPVRFQEVRATGESVERSLAGVARAGVESRLSFRVGGTVEAVMVSLGDSVGRGDALARLDPTDYELRVEEAEAALAQGQASLRKAEADYDRVRALYENNNASKAELDAARAAAESGQASVEATSKQLERARQQLGYTVLRAPADGAIASVDIEINENVGSGKEVFMLTSGDRPEVKVAVPEVLIDRFSGGESAEVTFAALPGRVFPATITEVGVAATGTGTTFEFTARLEAKETAVRSGMAAEVVFRLEEGGDDRIVLPAVSVGEDREGRFVFVLEHRDEGVGIVRRRPVEVGQLGEGIEIAAGLREGELVVTAGVRRLSDGMRVRLLEDEG